MFVYGRPVRAPPAEGTAVPATTCLALAPIRLGRGSTCTAPDKAWREAGSELVTAKELSRITHLFFLSLRGSRATHRPAECSINSQRRGGAARHSAKNIRSTASGDGEEDYFPTASPQKGFLSACEDLSAVWTELWHESDQTLNFRNVAGS